MEEVKETVLVVGARPDSLGWWIARLLGNAGYTVVTAGPNNEDVLYKGASPELAADLMRTVQPRHVACTVGINVPRAAREPGWDQGLYDHLDVNVRIPMALLHAWLTRRMDIDEATGVPHQFVAISSNSAHIARSNSAAYCASKAALSMALRCVAREHATDTAPRRLIYGYEPGMLAATPMTTTVALRLSQRPGTLAGGLHRMPGVHSSGLETMYVARQIVNTMQHAGEHLNGTMIRLDAGEQ